MPLQQDFRFVQIRVVTASIPGRGLRYESGDKPILVSGNRQQRGFMGLSEVILKNVTWWKFENKAVITVAMSRKRALTCQNNAARCVL